VTYRSSKHAGATRRALVRKGAVRLFITGFVLLVVLGLLAGPV